MIDEGKIVSISEIHCEAKLNGDIKYKNHHLHLIFQVSKLIHILLKQIPMIFENALTAPHGDALIGLDLADSTNEV